MAEMGRPSSFKEEYVEQARKLARFGATEVEIAEFFEVNTSTIWRWRGQHEDFCNALKEAKMAADERVKHALYHRALGYSHPEDKIFNDSGKPLVVPTVKHYAPDTTAAIFWLKNRDPERWRDKREVEDVTPEDAPATQSNKELARALAAILSKGMKADGSGA